jgi:hypothetical protein
VELDGREQRDELDRFWDAAVTGDPTPRTGRVDALTRQVIAKLAEPAPEDRSAAKQRTRRIIVAASASNANGGERGAMAVAVEPAPAPVGIRREDRADPGLYRIISIAGAIAAVLAVVVAIAYYGFNVGRGEPHRRTLPAAIEEPTPSPAPEVSTLVEIEIPADALPKSYAGASMARYTIPATTDANWTVFQNALLVYVRLGSLKVSADSPMLLQRAGGSEEWETVPSGSDVSLDGGDAVMMLNMSASTFANDTALPVDLIIWSLSTETPSSSPAPAKWILGDYALSGSAGSNSVLLQGRPATLRIELQAIEAGATLPAVTADQFQMVIAWPVNADATPVAASISRMSTGEVLNYSSQSKLIVKSTFVITGGEGTPVIQTPTP